MGPGRAEGGIAFSGRGAFVDLSDWHKVLTRGSHARGWLNDLLTADIGALPPGASRPALLLSPTGRIRATVTVASIGRGLLLIQDPVQPQAIEALLAPYTLSSDVELADVSGSMTLLAFPGGQPPHVSGAELIRPSSLGAGADLIVPGEGVEAARIALRGLVQVSSEALEEWRIHRGIPRFPIDLTPDSLPHEADLDAAIDYGKGCYLGQEAVAKVRNLGHPAWVVLSMGADGPVAVGDAVLGDDEEVGRVTSAATTDGRVALIARVRWSARERALVTGSGTPLQTAGLSAVG